jgi:hypothetical protein
MAVADDDECWCFHDRSDHVDGECHGWIGWEQGCPCPGFKLYEDQDRA